MTSRIELTANEMERRSVLMRLYSAYQRGEGYPARFVNGAAGGLIEDGYIVREGDEYRLTAAGVRHWAEMAVNTMSSNSEWDTAPMRGLREIANGEDGMDCVKPGCERPRMLNKKGMALTRCEEHQREYWRENKRKHDAKKKDPTAKENPSQSRVAALVPDHAWRQYRTPPPAVPSVHPEADMQAVDEQFLMELRGMLWSLLMEIARDKAPNVQNTLLLCIDRIDEEMKRHE